MLIVTGLQKSGNRLSVHFRDSGLVRYFSDSTQLWFAVQLDRDVKAVVIGASKESAALLVGREAWADLEALGQGQEALQIPDETSAHLRRLIRGYRDEHLPEDSASHAEPVGPTSEVRKRDGEVLTGSVTAASGSVEFSSTTGHRFCGECGVPVDGAMRFCLNCGALLEAQRRTFPTSNGPRPPVVADAPNPSGASRGTHHPTAAQSGGEALARATMAQQQRERAHYEAISRDVQKRRRVRTGRLVVVGLAAVLAIGAFAIVSSKDSDGSSSWDGDEDSWGANIDVGSGGASVETTAAPATSQARKTSDSIASSPTSNARGTCAEEWGRTFNDPSQNPRCKDFKVLDCRITSQEYVVVGNSIKVLSWAGRTYRFPDGSEAFRTRWTYGVPCQ